MAASTITAAVSKSPRAETRSEVRARTAVRHGVRTKICGITCVDDALAAIDLGAGLIGFNFYPPSPRYVTPEDAGELVRAVRRVRPDSPDSPDSRVLWVGVFVDESAEHVARVAQTAELDLVQLHGDEDPAEMAALGDLVAKIIKVFRVRPGDADEARGDVAAWVARKMEPWRALGAWGFLVDTHHPDLYGGTGESWDFAALKDLAERSDVRVLLAGGLTPDNVGSALTACRPWGLDLCSGVESEPGRKDSHLMTRLFEEIHHGTTPPAT